MSRHIAIYSVFLGASIGFGTGRMRRDSPVKHFSVPTVAGLDSA